MDRPEVIVTMEDGPATIFFADSIEYENGVLVLRLDGKIVAVFTKFLNAHPFAPGMNANPP